MHLMAQTSVVSLAEFEADIRMHDRVTKPRENCAIVVNNVAIVQSDDRCLAAGQDIAISHPALAALPVGTHLKAVFVERPVKALHARAVVPEHPNVAGQYTDAALDLLELLGGGLSEGQNEL